MGEIKISRSPRATFPIFTLFQQEIVYSSENCHHEIFTKTFAKYLIRFNSIAYNVRFIDFNLGDLTANVYIKTKKKISALIDEISTKELQF